MSGFFYLHWAMEILELPDQGAPFELPDARLRLFKNFFDKKEAAHYYNTFLTQIPWQQDPITVFGKTYPQPRLTALHAVNGNSYSYSGILMRPHKMTPELVEIASRIASYSPVEFTTVLLNLYRNGSDSNGWHADNEKELGKNPVIASVSLGASRFFHLKHRTIKELRYKIKLESGSLLFMEGTTQEKWLHQLPKTAKPIAPRINLTFRKII